MIKRNVNVEKEAAPGQTEERAKRVVAIRLGSLFAIAYTSERDRKAGGEAEVVCTGTGQNYFALTALLIA